MTRWEYHYELVQLDEFGGIAPSHVVELDRLGGEGWEPFAVSPSDESGWQIMHLKRAMAAEKEGTPK